MLQKSKSSSAKLLKFVMVLPLLAVMVLYASCSQETDKEITETEASSDSEVMAKIVELSEAIMKVGNLTDEEAKALEFLATPYKGEGKVYESVEEYLEDQSLLAQNVVKDEYSKDLAFMTVDKVPTYPGCSGTNEELKACMIEKINQFIGAEFNSKAGDKLNLTGRQRIVVQFKIDNTGQVSEIKARAEHQVLMDEAERVIAKIPKMLPAEHKGKKVAIRYSVPIIFEIE